MARRRRPGSRSPARGRPSWRRPASRARMPSTEAPMKPELSLRPFAIGDTDAVIDLRNRAFDELSGDAYSPAQKAAQRENRTESGYAEDLIRNHIMLGFDGGLGLVAMGGWIAMPDDPEIGRIRKLAVHPAVARRGLGRRMVEDAEQRARDA